MKIRVAGAQVPEGRDIEANAAAIERGIQFARSQRADMLLTPEGALSGYTHEFDAAAVRKALKRILARAKEARVGLALGTCFVEPKDGKCYNQLRLYRPDGTYLGFHSKILTCGTWDTPPKGEINHYAVAPLRTFRYSGIRVGALICNDLWANPGCTPIPDPHLTQQLAGQGARILLHAANCGSSKKSERDRRDVAWDYHGSNLRMRARAGKLWIVTVNRSNGPARCGSQSGVVDPEGNWACRAKPKGEQFFAYTIRV
ncbi:MAG: carbon-nitrogen hydrolase family protein [Kiritimatiellae bacterium]|nr:carbon-nitrogen hydrolase family protein [Kiritimatiellia bacterium]